MQMISITNKDIASIIVDYLSINDQGKFRCTCKDFAYCQTVDQWFQLAKYAASNGKAAMFRVAIKKMGIVDQDTIHSLISLGAGHIDIITQFDISSLDPVMMFNKVLLKAIKLRNRKVTHYIIEMYNLNSSLVHDIKKNNLFNDMYFEDTNYIANMIKKK